MKIIRSTLCMVGLLIGTAAANATVVTGTFSGTVTSGYANGSFGYVSADLAGQALSGTISYDTDLLGGNCSPGTYFFGCFTGAAGMTITQTINGHTETFPGTLPNDPALPAWNGAQSGLLLYNLTGEGVNFHTSSSVGDPATIWKGYETALGLALPDGAIADANDPIFVYDGTIPGLGYEYVFEGQNFWANHTEISELDGGDLTQNTRFDFQIDHLTLGVLQSGAVPEPAAWLFMATGFGMLGAMLRRHPRAALA